MASERAALEVTVSEGVAEVVLKGPGKGNALGPDFWAEMPEVADELDRDPAVRVVVVRGSGAHFTYGLDLPAMGGLFALVARDPRCACPAQVVERAHRWADRIALVSNREPAARASPPADVRDAIRALEALAAWCAARPIAVDGAPGPGPPLAPPAAPA